MVTFSSKLKGTMHQEKAVLQDTAIENCAKPTFPL